MIMKKVMYVHWRHAKPPKLRLFLEVNGFDVWHPYYATELDSHALLKVESVDGEEDLAGYERPINWS